MWRGARPSFRWVAGVCAAGGFALALALFIAVAVSGSDAADEYGRISVPGSGALELPEGDVALFYEERVTLSENESLPVPPGLRVRARREQTIESENTTNNAINLDGRSLREFAKLEVPAAGSYRVSVRADASGGNSPSVTFGKGLGASMAGAGVKAGIAAGAGLALGLLLLLAGRIGYEPAPVIRPVAPSTSSPPPRPPEPAPDAADGDIQTALADLRMRRTAGLIGEEEYEAERKRLLASL